MNQIHLPQSHVATLPCRGRVGLPKAVRGGVTPSLTLPRMRGRAERGLKRCHPLPARKRGPTSPLQGEVKKVYGKRSFPPAPSL